MVYNVYFVHIYSYSYIDTLCMCTYKNIFFFHTNEIPNYQNYCARDTFACWHCFSVAGFITVFFGAAVVVAAFVLLFIFRRFTAFFGKYSLFGSTQTVYITSITSNVWHENSSNVWNHKFLIEHFIGHISQCKKENKLKK